MYDDTLYLIQNLCDWCCGEQIGYASDADAVVVHTNCSWLMILMVMLKSMKSLNAADARVGAEC